MRARQTNRWWALAMGLAAAGWIVAAGAQRAAGAEDDTGPQRPDATLTFRGRTATVGVGFVWGASTVEYQGRSYPVRVDGFVLGAIGTASIDGRGQVFDLSQVEDLNGDYTALASSGAFGVGSGRLVMRNQKGVRIVLDATSKGLQLGIGPRGITLSVGEADGPPASAEARLPETLGFGEARFGRFSFRPTLNAQLVGFAEGSAGFNGQWSAGPVERADYWFEHSNEIGLNAIYDAGDYGTLKARVSGVLSLTGGGVDAAVSNGSEVNNHQYSLESAYLTWQSGNLFPKLGYNALELGGGNMNYQVFDGFLFWDGGQDSGDRGGNWLSARKAFREVGLVRLNFGGLLLEGVHLKYNDDPDTGTRLVAGRIEYVKDHWIVEHAKLGLMYFKIYDSDQAPRDGMDGIYAYHEATPFSSLPGLTYTLSYASETHSKGSGLTTAYAWYVAPAYEFSSVAWKPKLTYRFAQFSGGGRHGFDSLFTGLADWGSWFQGEVLGEFVLSNSSLVSHQVRLELQPSESVKFNLIYYKFLLNDRKQEFGVAPSKVCCHALADEFDVITDVSLANWWSITATLGVAVPNQGFEQAVNGTSTWVHAMLYTNFNF